MRKLLGYRLKDEKYREAAEKIKGREIKTKVSGYDFRCDTFTHNKLSEAGVMHWFEEVYEEEDKFTGWAKSDLPGNSNWMAYFEDNDFKYGIDSGGDWFIKDRYFNFKYSNQERPATTEEIQQALHSEIKKRYKEGDKVKSLRGGIMVVGQLEELRNLANTDNEIWVSGEVGNPQVFKDGKWAEIIPTETLNGKTAIIDGVEYEIKIK